MTAFPVAGKQFEKATPGMYLGTLIDLYDLGVVPSKNPAFAAQHRCRVIWALGKSDGSGYVLDSEGKPLLHSEAPTYRMGDGGNGFKKTRLYEIAEGILQAAPPVDCGEEHILGKSNMLYVVKDGDFVKIAGFLPVPPGLTPPVAPVGFLRDKDNPEARAKRAAKKAQQAANPGTSTNAPAAQPAQAPAAAAAEPVKEVAF